MMEFDNVAALQDHYKAVRKRLQGTPPPPVKIAPIKISLPPATEEQPQQQPRLSELSVADYLKHVGRLRTDLTFLNVLAITARHFNISYKEIRAKCRLSAVVVPRQIAIWFCFKYKVQTFVCMARYLNMDHTTMLYAYQKIERHRNGNGKLKPLILSTEETILAAFNRTPLPADH